MSRCISPAYPTLEWNRQRYELKNGYELREQLKRARFQWDPAAKVWHTDNPKHAVRAIRFATPEVRAMLLHFLA